MYNSGCWVLIRTKLVTRITFFLVGKIRVIMLKLRFYQITLNTDVVENPVYEVSLIWCELRFDWFTAAVKAKNIVVHTLFTFCWTQDLSSCHGTLKKISVTSSQSILSYRTFILSENSSLALCVWSYLKWPDDNRHIFPLEINDRNVSHIASKLNRQKSDKPQIHICI